MEFPGWSDLRAASLPAVLGAVLSLGVLLVLGLVTRRGRAASRSLQAEALEAGLRAFAAEVEARLDAKIDRLEALLVTARTVLREGVAKGAAKGAAKGTGEGAAEGAADAVRGVRSGSVAALPHGALGSRWDAAAVSLADRNRVLQLAEMGKLPESIADSVGLLRGEVDLILRLHRSAGRVEES